MASLDVDGVAPWLDAQGIAPGLPIACVPIGGGASNAMFRLTRGERRLVLRRPARVAIARADDGMRREFRILAALEGTDVPHPAPVALCEDRALLGCVFYLMEAVEGRPAIDLPESFDRRAVTHAVVDALAALHAVDYRARGLEDLGRIDGFHERQVSRWSAQYGSEGGREPARLAVVGAWLDAHRPSDWRPSLMHGDYHMFNLMLAPDPPPRVAAIVDWETATIGDPLLDLAGLCEVWTNAFGSPPWPTRAEMIERYAERRGLRTPVELRYYEVLYNFRLCVLLEGVFQRSRRDETRTPNTMAGERAAWNLARAEQLSSNDP